MANIVILIPAFNEEKLIGETVRSALEMPGISEVVVIDDGSEDETAFIAYEAGARVIQMDKNSGKGAAMNRGVEESSADIYLIIDGDLGKSANEAYPLLEPVLSGHADMSIAIMKTPANSKGGFGCVLKLAKWAIQKYGGAEVTAPISGQRAIKKEVIESIGGFAKGFGVETALTIDALRKGYKIVEVPLPLTHRVTGRSLSGFAHRMLQFWDIMWAVWRRRK